MRKLLVVLAIMLMPAMAFAQTIMTNTITSPTDGEVNVIPYEPYTIPMTGFASATGAVGDFEIVIVLDESGSISGSEWTLEKGGAQYLVNALQNPGDPTSLLARVGLVGFSGSSYKVLTPPSTSHSAVTSAITSWPKHGGMTSFGAGLLDAWDVFSWNGHADDEICFFFSNGGHNTSPAYEPIAGTMHSNGVLVNSFGIASGANEYNLKWIAGTTDGTGGDSSDHYWYAPSFGQLTDAIDLAIPGTGTVDLDRVEVYVDGAYTGDAVLAPGGIYSSSVDIKYGPTLIQTDAYATDGTMASDQVTKYGVPVSQPIPEPGTMILLSTGLTGLLGYAVRRRRRSK